MTISLKQLEGHVIVITGASSGFGKGAALKFAQTGSSVVLAARRDELLDELARECESAGGRAFAVATDVSNPADVEQLAQAAISQFGRIDVWVNNAGVGAIDPQDEVSVGTAAKVMTFAHQAAPGMTVSMMGKQTHKAQIEKAPPGENTRGSIHEPSEEGTEVSGGRLDK